MDNNIVDNNIQEDRIIFCVKCGAEMKMSSRYCMKCGALNYDHPLNASMREYVKEDKGGSEEYISLSNGSIKPQSHKTCCVVTLFLSFFLPVVFTILLLVFKAENIVSLLFTLYMMGGITFLYTYSIECIYIKANKPWWSIYVPFYGNYVFFDITLDNGWLFLLSLVPGIGLILLLISLYKLGKLFSRSGLLTVFFPFIMIPVIGFDKNSNLSLINAMKEKEISNEGRTKSEVTYRRNRVMVTLIIFIIIGILVFLLWPYLEKFILIFIKLLRDGIEFFMN